MSKPMKPYLVQPEFKFDPGMSDRDYIHHQQKELRRIEPLVSEIVRRDGGQVTSDGMGFGSTGHSDRWRNFMVVEVSETAAKELARIPAVNVMENGRGHVQKKTPGMKM